MRIAPLKVLSDGTIVDEDMQEDVLFYKGWQPTKNAFVKDFDESARLSLTIHAIKSQCWFNARRAILRLDEYAEAGWDVGSYYFDCCHSIHLLKSVSKVLIAIRL